MIPYRNRLLIVPDKSTSVLLSPDEKFQQIGTIVQTGWKPWYLFWKTSLFKKGDRVVFNVWGVDSVKINGEEYFFVLEDADFILGKYEMD